ncbi:hypothetical protein EV127DRAFT_481001 [Xylaria flabelliformis]|nr:hypothetical protein EV127DRAFT_481001 [Xylaria flabelliformis]
MGPRNKPADEEKLLQINSIFREIKTIYDAGTPIFTKDNMRKVGEELRHFQKGERNDGGNIIMRGINGVDYEVFIRPPGRRPSRENEHVRGPSWVIRYYSIKDLTCFKHPDIELFDLQSAYLPMRICSIVRILYNIDKNPLYTKPPAPPEEDLSTYQTIEKQWKTSEHYTQIHEMLAKIEIPFTLTKIIAVALGPLVVNSQVLQGRVFQHSLVIALYSTLVRRGTLSVSSKPYIQDPAYTQRDRDILCSAKFIVLDDPQAWLEINESSVLVCINADIPVRDIVADIGRPALIIWDRNQDSSNTTPRVKTMIENEYSETEFPYHECFGDLVMLIRKST